MSRGVVRGQWTAGIALAAAVVLLVWMLSAPVGREKPEARQANAGDAGDAAAKGPLGEALPGYEAVGGVYRPKADLNYPASNPADSDKPVIDTGFAPPVKPDANTQAQAVFTALKSGEHPERFSSFVQPPAFDRAAWEKDPDAYLAIVEPGRVYQSAEPGSDVQVIQAISGQFQRVKQGDQIPLVVKAAPNAPVTFTSFDLGHFENQLTSTTVRTNADGEARVLFTAGKGTIDDIEILAASPLTTGQVRFVVNVKL
ncbi:MAG: hypothetical protein U0996_21840 [Planctomycetaceae bacterium]